MNDLFKRPYHFCEARISKADIHEAIYQCVSWLLIAIGVLVVLGQFSRVRAQSGSCWGPACTPPVGGQATEASLRQASYRWRTRADDPERIYLYRDGVQIGGYCFAENVYRGYDASTGAWAAAGVAPIAVPPITAMPSVSLDREKSAFNFGVDTSRIGGERYVFSQGPLSTPISKQQAYDVMQKQLVDDSKKLRVTVFGSPEERRPVLEQLAREPRLSDWAIVRGYDSNHWVATSAGFRTTGKPTIYCQAPTGKVLHRQDDYAGGSEALVSALRRAKEAYDYRKDPDLRESKLLGPFAAIDPGRVLSYLAAALAGIFGVDLFSRRGPVS